MKYSGRGRSPSTLLWHIKNMYEKKISKPPQITLKSFEKAQIYTFFVNVQRTWDFLMF